MPEAAGPISVTNGTFLKYVVQPGVLQDKPGPSIATEFGPLLLPLGARALDLVGPASCRSGGNGAPFT